MLQCFVLPATESCVYHPFNVQQAHVKILSHFVCKCVCVCLLEYEMCCVVRLNGVDNGPHLHYRIPVVLMF